MGRGRGWLTVAVCRHLAPLTHNALYGFRRRSTGRVIGMETHFQHTSITELAQWVSAWARASVRVGGGGSGSFMRAAEGLVLVRGEGGAALQLIDPSTNNSTKNSCISGQKTDAEFQRNTNYARNFSAVAKETHN